MLFPISNLLLILFISFFTETEETERKHSRYRFNVQSINKMAEKVTKAELHLFKQYDPTQRSRYAFLQIDVIKSQNNRVISSRILSTRAHGWITFPLTKTVSRWVRKPHKNYGIRIQIKQFYNKAGGGQQPQEAALQFGTKNSFRREPMLVVFSKRIKGSNLDSLFNEKELVAAKKKLAVKKRHARASPKTIINLTDELSKRNNRTDAICHLRPLNVSVMYFGFDMKLIYPSVFIVNQCVGTCKFKQLHKAQTNHALFQAYRAAESYREEGEELSENHVDPPCCAPSAYESQLVIFKNAKSQVTILNLENMKATQCKCL